MACYAAVGSEGSVSYAVIRGMPGGMIPSRRKSNLNKGRTVSMSDVEIVRLKPRGPTVSILKQEELSASGFRRGTVEGYSVIIENDTDRVFVYCPLESGRMKDTMVYLPASKAVWISKPRSTQCRMCRFKCFHIFLRSVREKEQ